MQIERKIKDLSVGMEATLSKVITENDVITFSELTGDTNPVHLDEAYASKTRFKKRIAHGMLSASFFSALFATRLPGPGAIYIRQNLVFKYPVYLGDNVESKISITSINKESNRVVFSTQCHVGTRLVVDGEAEIMLP